MRPGGVIGRVDGLELEELDGVVEEGEDDDGEDVAEAVVLARLGKTIARKVSHKYFLLWRSCCQSDL